MIESLDVLGNAISKHDQNNQITVIDTFNKNNKYEILKITLMKMRLLIKKKIWYLFAIKIIDTQVARRGRQYYCNPILTLPLVLMTIYKKNYVVL